MSIDHKAYLFRFDEFQTDLGQILEAALRDGQVDAPHAFIDVNIERLTDPITREPLAEGWEDEEGREDDVQLLADIALTKYYDLNDNRGLSYGFDALGAYFDSVAALRDISGLLIAGRLFGPKGQRLDTGSMGTGMLAHNDVLWLLREIDTNDLPPVPDADSPIFSNCYYKPDSADSVRESLEQLRYLYRAARDQRTGLLFVDFNDRGAANL